MSSTETFNKKAREIIANRKTVSGTGTDPRPVDDAGVVTSESPPDSPSTTETQESTEQAAPRPDVQAEPSGEGEKRVPLKRLQRETAKAKTATEAQAKSEKELKKLRQQVADGERKDKIRAIRDGENRPDGWGDMSPSDQSIWVTQKMLELQPTPAAADTEDAPKTDIEQKWDLMVSSGFDAQQVEVLFEIKKENPKMAEDRVMLIAALENPDLFEVVDDGEEEERPSLPASHKVSAARPSRTKAVQKKDPVAEAKAAAVGAKTAPQRRKAGIEIIKAARQRANEARRRA